MESPKLEIIMPNPFESAEKPRKAKLVVRSKCIRCGTCCKQVGPVLLKNDISLFDTTISCEQACTVREGEAFRVPGDGELHESSMELIRIREKPGMPGCIFFEEDTGCVIYENRPSLCREYECWSPENITGGLEEISLKRIDLFGTIRPIVEAIRRHEEKCSYAKLLETLQKMERGDENAAEDVLEILRYDTYIRPFIDERFSLPPGTLDLIFGRPLTETIRVFGYAVEHVGDEYLLDRIQMSNNGTA